jgi:hypothetical protein
MNARSESLALEKQALLMRSALCRLRLRRETHMLRAQLSWKRALAATVAAPEVREVAFGLAISLAGLGRTARVLMLATRALFIAKLVRVAIGYVRGNRETGRVRYRTDDAAIGA